MPPRVMQQDTSAQSVTYICSRHQERTGPGQVDGAAAGWGFVWFQKACSDAGQQNSPHHVTSRWNKPPSAQLAGPVWRQDLVSRLPHVQSPSFLCSLTELTCCHRGADQTWRHQVRLKWRDAHVPPAVWEGAPDHSLLCKKLVWQFSPFAFHSVCHNLILHTRLCLASPIKSKNQKRRKEVCVFDEQHCADMFCSCWRSRRFWLFPSGGVPTSRLSSQAEAQGAGALPPRKAGGRAAGQHGWRPLHLRRPGGLWLWEQEKTQSSVLLHGWRRLHWRSSVPNIVNDNRPVLLVKTLPSSLKAPFWNFVHFLFNSVS